LELKIELVF